MFWGTSEIVLLLLAGSLFLGALEFGFRMGRRQKDQSDEPARTHVGALQGALLGLLALLLGFTFAMAVSRLDTRKELVLEEANAIGTAFLRARFLPAPQSGEVARLLKDYVSALLDFHAAGIVADRLEAANRTAARIEGQLWELTVSSVVQDTDSVPTGLFIQSINEVIDVRERRRAALDNHVPEAIVYILYATAVTALGIVGYACGLTRRRRFVPNAVVACLIALVLTTILDIDRPRRGLIQVSQDSLIRLKAAMDAPAPKQE